MEEHPRHLHPANAEELAKIAEQEGLLSLTLQLNGEPLDSQVLDSFVFEVKERFRGARA